ncbi:MAG: Hsp20/alpha crystallin family protein [Verrucomicrobiae bacterium]|nr:Hsp20/alpha crystallin family protein [Verrucomicrobiae bacterium]
MSSQANTQVAPNCCDVAPEKVATPLTREREVEPRYHTRRVDEHTWQLGVVLPGVKRDDIEISLEENELEVVAHRRHNVPENWRPVQTERPVPTVYRLELTLAIDVDPERISAKLENGILTLNLPVAESAKPRRISVE